MPIISVRHLGIEEICPRIVVINRGRLIYDGPIQALQARSMASPWTTWWPASSSPR